MKDLAYKLEVISFTNVQKVLSVITDGRYGRLHRVKGVLGKIGNVELDLCYNLTYTFMDTHTDHLTSCCSFFHGVKLKFNHYML